MNICFGFSMVAPCAVFRKTSVTLSCGNAVLNCLSSIYGFLSPISLSLLKSLMAYFSDLNGLIMVLFRKLSVEIPEYSRKTGIDETEPRIPKTKKTTKRTAITYLLLGKFTLLKNL